MEYLITFLFMVTPPDRQYDANNECKGLYKVHYDLPAIGGCTGWKNKTDEAKSKAKWAVWKGLFNEEEE